MIELKQILIEHTVELPSLTNDQQFLPFRCVSFSYYFHRAMTCGNMTCPLDIFPITKHYLCKLFSPNPSSKITKLTNLTDYQQFTSFIVSFHYFLYNITQIICKYCYICCFTRLIYLPTYFPPKQNFLLTNIPPIKHFLVFPPK